MYHPCYPSAMPVTTSNPEIEMDSNVVYLLTIPCIRDLHKEIMMCDADESLLINQMEKLIDESHTLSEGDLFNRAIHRIRKQIWRTLYPGEIIWVKILDIYKCTIAVKLNGFLS